MPHILFLFLFLFSPLHAQERLLGITEPYRKSVVSPPVVGILQKIHYTEGRWVKNGAVVISLEQSEEALELKRRKLIAENSVELQAAEFRASLFQNDFKITEELFQTTQSISKDELWKKELDYKLAEAEWKKLQFAKKREAVEAEIAQAQLEKKLIRAPFSGVIVRISKNKGETCSPQEPLFEIVDVSKVIFTTYLEAKKNHSLKLKQKVNVVMQQEGKIIEKTGELFFISPIVDPASGLREIKILIDNSDQAMTPGVSAWLNKQTL